MCMFTGPIIRVSSTHIFARADGELQALVYAMSLSVGEEVAMVLPLPVPAGSPEDALRFVDLSDYPKLFEDMAKGVFPIPASIPVQSLGAPPKTLEVHRVGSFDASFVPARSDFERLDPRFRLSGDVWDALPDYADWGFAVFQLRASTDSTPTKVHPMAFWFPRRDPGRLFYPTVHVHDGAVHDEAAFDHHLYYQPADGREPVRAQPGPGQPPPALSEWLASFAPAERFVDVARTAGLVDGDRYVWGRAMFGSRPNQDVWVDDPS